jgi:hypothetical protein
LEEARERASFSFAATVQLLLSTSSATSGAGLQATCRNTNRRRKEAHHAIYLVYVVVQEPISKEWALFGRRRYNEPCE